MVVGSDPGPGTIFFGGTVNMGRIGGRGDYGLPSWADSPSDREKIARDVVVGILTTVVAFYVLHKMKVFR